MKKEDLLRWIDNSYKDKEEILFILWTSEDVKSRENELGINLTPEERTKVLSRIDKDGTTGIGINWDVVDCYIYKIREERDK